MWPVTPNQCWTGSLHRSQRTNQQSKVNNMFYSFKKHNMGLFVHCQQNNEEENIENSKYSCRIEEFIKRGSFFPIQLYNLALVLSYQQLPLLAMNTNHFQTSDVLKGLRQVFSSLLCVCADVSTCCCVHQQHHHHHCTVTNTQTVIALINTDNIKQYITDIRRCD